MAIPSNILTLLAGVAITCLSLWYGQNHGLLPVAAATDAPLVDGLFNTMMTIATGLFLLVQGLIFVILWRFRRKPNDVTDAAPIHGNLALEILWTGIPVVIVLGLSVYSFSVYTTMGGLSVGHGGGHMAHAQPRDSAIAAELSSDSLQDSKSTPRVSAGLGAPTEALPDVTVNVKGLQFAWIFNYPSHNLIAGELHLPLGKSVQLEIEAQDVIHAFWVPQFRLKQDAIPGERTRLQFTPTQLGTYPIVCAELCGSYHGAMRSQVIVETPEDYDRWIQSQTTTAAVVPSRLETATAALDLQVEPEHLHHLHQLASSL
ncbi:cytochrome c oxidase subunit II [Synechococcus elongatus]|uniref:Cytochrome c oxidase subunit 2 n=2 Tax=Synechococcus elongatus TaxID=32046 RepID=Q31JY7_SYNE7|nr:cytochrome c oxidase subunit II [Synechococcus elongatus]MBD2688921.1 cytochrome c oxidase subunit II [Synechococcus elongatus FACHB-1061]ABB58632.1 cytochrome c oxidase subunit II [Synechococcus elongatus PCC 7942 = FACHB-805]AJD56915.1 cytochrome C oxidase subunit II [Synechococcus elongatus UTEX 2973]MBD2587853.1 cytochrome c oxidase subunit II [Synechococcus elongatus FACHB-242]MBD2707439.1 cytochrome c oxidase subunit II [Synechococcus elongatus PCC 7942 = FACHB-805]